MAKCDAENILAAKRNPTIVQEVESRFFLLEGVRNKMKFNGEFLLRNYFFPFDVLKREKKNSICFIT